MGAGRTYEREGIEGFWRKSGRYVDPLSNRSLRRRELYTNWDKRGEVQRFLDQHPGYIPEGWDSRQVPGAVQDPDAAGSCVGLEAVQMPAMLEAVVMRPRYFGCLAKLPGKASTPEEAV